MRFVSASIECVVIQHKGISKSCVAIEIYKMVILDVPLYKYTNQHHSNLCCSCRRVVSQSYH